MKEDLLILTSKWLHCLLRYSKLEFPITVRNKVFHRSYIIYVLLCRQSNKLYLFFLQMSLKKSNWLLTDEKKDKEKMKYYNWYAETLKLCCLTSCSYGKESYFSYDYFQTCCHSCRSTWICGNEHRTGDSSNRN